MSEINCERTVQNGRSILSMWLIARLIVKNPQDFFIQKTCKIILAKFKKFTNLCEKSLSFDEQDQIFLVYTVLYYLLCCIVLRTVLYCTTYCTVLYYLLYCTVNCTVLYCRES